MNIYSTSVHNCPNGKQHFNRRLDNELSCIRTMQSCLATDEQTRMHVTTYMNLRCILLREGSQI